MSTKKPTRARKSAPSADPEAGSRCEGYVSARNWDTIADSVMISLL